MFGFDVAIISGAVPFIQPYFGWNELQLGWGVSSLLVGAIIGAFGSGVLSDMYGRKSVLIVVAIPAGRFQQTNIGPCERTYTSHFVPCEAFLSRVPGTLLHRPFSCHS